MLFRSQKVTIDGKEIEFTISFGGSFFALVDTTKLDIGEINPKTVPAYAELGMKMLEIINRDIPIQHPLLDITSVDLVEFYGPTPNPDKANMRNAEPAMRSSAPPDRYLSLAREYSGTLREVLGSVPSIAAMARAQPQYLHQ